MSSVEPLDNIEHELTPDELADANAKILLKQAKAIGKDRGKVASMVITIAKLEKDIEILQGNLATANVTNYDLSERNNELVSIINALGGKVPAKKDKPIVEQVKLEPQPAPTMTKEKTSSCVIS